MSDPAVSDESRSPRPGETADLRLVAIIAAADEADVLPIVAADLAAQGIGLYLLDDGSTDGTVERTAAAAGAHLLGVERLPQDGRFELARIVARKAELATTLPGDWFLNADADEFRESPWRELTLPQALARVERLGFDAVDFAVHDFHADRELTPGEDPRTAFPLWTPGAAWNHLQIRCWKRQPAPVEMAHGGHDVTFPGRRVFPVRFLLRHYPFRGPAHARRKLAARRARYDAGERARGWHRQYDTVELDALPAGAAPPAPADLRTWDPDAVRLRVCVENRVTERLRGEPAAVAAEVEEARREVVRLEAELALRYAENGRLQQAADDIAAEGARLRAALDERRAETTRLQRELDARWGELARAAEEIAARDAERARLAAAAAELDSAAREIAAIRASRSWRWTAPLRWLAAPRGR